MSDRSGPRVKQPRATRAPGRPRPRWLVESLTASRFAVVGAGATATHLLVAWLLVTRVAVPPLFANGIAFFCAFGISFTGHYLWTFGSPGRLRRSLLRFLSVSLMALVASSALLALAMYSERLSGTTAVLATALIIPVITFAASRLWGFVVD